MKKTTLLYLLACCLCITQCYGQLNHGGQTQAYLIGKSFLYFNSDFIDEDTTGTGKSAAMKIPFNGRYIITGASVAVNIFQYTATDVWSGTFAFNGNSLSALGSVNQAAYNINNLQARVTLNGNIISDWTDVNAYPAFKDPSIHEKANNKALKTYYAIASKTLALQESLVVMLRQKDNSTAIATLTITRKPLTIQPFLAIIAHDSLPNTTPDEFVQKQVSEWFNASGRINSLYKNRAGTGLTLNNQRYYPSSKLAFYFKRPTNYPDSSLEYQLTGGAYHDNAWHLSGHLIFATRLQADRQYQLLVRYKNSDTVAKYTFYVPPAWYQKYMYLLVYIPSFLVLFFATVLIARYRVKKANAKREALAMELKSIRSQLNPHFVFNALSSIQALINKNEVDLANQYLTEFSSLLRDSLQNHNTDFAPLAIEIKMLENYIKLEHLRFNFKYSITVADFIDVNTTEVPLLLLQPVVENAIKHGIATLKEEGVLQVAFSRQGASLVIVVKDNGKGFEAGNAITGKHGLRLTRERINLVNKKLKGQQVRFDITSQPGNTTATFIFDNWL